MKTIMVFIILFGLLALVIQAAHCSGLDAHDIMICIVSGRLITDMNCLNFTGLAIVCAIISGSYNSARTLHWYEED